MILDLKMTSPSHIVNRAMSLMKAHVRYSQNLAVEFTHLIEDYEKMVASPINAQEAVDIAKEPLENDSIDLTRPCSVEQTAVIYKEAVNQSYEDLISNNPVVKLQRMCNKELEKRLSITKIKKRELTSTYVGGKSFECSICNRQLGNKSAFIRHMKVHKERNPYKCTTCSKMFCRKGFLDLHSRIHMD